MTRIKIKILCSLVSNFLNVWYLIFPVTVDLCDEKGTMKKLFENPDSYANEYLSDRDSFILIQVESEFFEISMKNVSLDLHILMMEMLKKQCNAYQYRITYPVHKYCHQKPFL